MKPHWELPPHRMPAMRELPDPFLMTDRNRVRDLDDWSRRREEIRTILACCQYGRMPAAPSEVVAEETESEKIFGGAATRIHLTLSTGVRRQVRIRVGMLVPRGRGPFPAIIKNDRALDNVPIAEEIVGKGYILVEYVRDDLDADNADRTDGVHPIYPGYDWGTLAAWAWGGMRVVDHLLSLGVVDADRIAITGHSRGGKTALLAAAFDERIALAVPNGSGSGGAGSYRILGRGAETLKDIVTNFPYWFVPRLKEFVGLVERLPFDQHFLRALVAPRAVLSTDALGDLWANPLGTQHVYIASQQVFDWLGAGKMNGIHFRAGGHDQSPEDWRALVEFADMVFFGEPPASGRRFDQLPFPGEGRRYSWSAPN